MAGRFLLDTNIVIALFAQEPSVLQRLDEAEEVFLPSVVLGELYYGARKSAKTEANVSRVDELAGRSSVLACDGETAQHYGEVKNLLRAKGRPLPENDVWVAAIALQHGLILVTRDAHFNEIEDLTVVAW
jgi:tRNA(fMet)-specific endonuclease VapC